ncbi:hypothetical protein HU200_051208 [Digitaria exilis]|uniref:MATH domain-containing protein n=1 Tax=Digitaria exilis TaxID=1010633 RepID=A0A835AWG3_9POAL|nr:hypothetical protein HU200_051208 [Digitaria exilis]CAB3480046.1 unnamed protein product [Digitaria exilis]
MTPPATPRTISLQRGHLHGPYLVAAASTRDVATFIVLEEGDDKGPTGKNPASCGYVDFITKEDLGRWRPWPSGPGANLGIWSTRQQCSRRQRMCGGYSSDEGLESDGEDGGGGGSRGGRRDQSPPRDKEFIGQCLAERDDEGWPAPAAVDSSCDAMFDFVLYSHDDGLSKSVVNVVAEASRSAVAVVAKAARGFQLLRIDGYSLTTTLPGGEHISSAAFTIGGRSWCVDYYPNGVDASTDSDSDAIAVYLRLVDGTHTGRKERVRADYKFSLLDAVGNAAYELPAERGMFVAPSGGGGDYGQEGDNEGPTGKNPASCGYADFITKDNLERRRESLIREDSLAIRCDVGVVEVEAMAVGPKQQRNRRQRVCGGGYSSDEGPVSDEEDDGGGSLGGHRRGQPPPNDKEFVCRCLAAHLRKY